MLILKKVEKIISVTLIIGTFLSALLVMIGGTLYLLQNGSESMHWELLQTDSYSTSISQIWYNALSFSPLGIIELGLIVLVGTQILRVAFLAGFYILISDYRFATFSLFILSILIYSLFWRS